MSSFKLICTQFYFLFRWGQISILECLIEYDCTISEAELIIRNVLPKLQHANHAVVLACVRLILSKLNSVEV